jgi:HYDIN/CFA65/VesB-like, Ig-like domain
MKHLLACTTLLMFLAYQADASTIYQDDFEDGNLNGWSTNGDVSVTGLQAIGQYSMRLKQTANSTATVSTAGYSAVSITMNLAATSLETGDDCYAEVSTNGGGAWTTVVLVQNGNDNGTFFQGTVSPAGADNNAGLLLRFRSTGANAGDYCYGDNVTVDGTQGGIDPEPDINVTGSGSFGNVDINTSADRTLTVSNVGTASLVIGSLYGLAAPFSVVSDSCSNQTIAASASCAVTTRFAPTATGFASDDLNIPSNDPDEAVAVVNVNGTGTEPGGTVDDFDPLSGNGNVNRSNLTHAFLTGGSDPGSRVDVSAYGVPVNAAQPSNNFEGRLTLSGEATGGSFDEIKDTFRYTGSGDTTRKHLPEFDFDFVQTGTHLVPTARGSIASAHPEWEYILEPGRVWQENSDNGYSRAAVPFSLHQKNANCMHNGLLSFLFKADGSVSKVAYQVSSETCLYFKFDMWGLLNASYTPAAVANAATIKADHQNEVNGRMPVKPISALATDFPGADPSQFGSAAETDPAHMTLFGFVINGTNYVGGCGTRYGTHPYCDSVTVPSYSTAKTLFAGTALMRMEKKYPGFMNNTVAPRVSDCNSNGNWGDVTYANVIDMGTGNYKLSGYMSDEGASHTNDLFLPEDHASKISYSCTEYPRKAAPGTKWVYHTSDTYILGTAMNADIKQLEGSSKDIFEDTILNELWRPLGVSKGAEVSRRTYDSVAQPFTGWGLTFLRDDVAKLTTFLNVDDGKIGGVPMLDAAELDAAMQRDPSDRGLDPLVDFKYNNGFWAHEISADLGCAADLWVPFMSGYGGITVLLLPNDTTYYYFSDNDTYLWKDAAIESHQISPMCP